LDEAGEVEVSSRKRTRTSVDRRSRAVPRGLKGRPDVVRKKPRHMSACPAATKLASFLLASVDAVNQSDNNDDDDDDDIRFIATAEELQQSLRNISGEQQTPRSGSRPA
jgi:aminoglycoside phosphotransferase